MNKLIKKLRNQIFNVLTKKQKFRLRLNYKKWFNIIHNKSHLFLNEVKIVISIICVFNDKKILNKYLLESLKDQTAHYELILIDNTKNKFKSASKALNYGTKKAKGNYLMFIHQDVSLCSDTWLDEAEKIIESLDCNAIMESLELSEKEFIIGREVEIY